MIEEENANPSKRMVGIKNSNSSFPDSFVKTPKCCYEGYWKGDLPGQVNYPLPIPNNYMNFQLIVEFLIQLCSIQDNIEKFGGSMEHPRGFSYCRLCNKMDNGAKEYSLPSKEYGEVKWPEGLLHYYKDHRVIPSEEFYNFIKNVKEIFTYGPVTKKMKTEQQDIPCPGSGLPSDHWITTMETEQQDIPCSGLPSDHWITYWIT